MKPRLSLRSGLAGLALLAGAVALPAHPTAAAIEGTVDIRVELDLPYDDDSDGPRVFEVTGVTPGPGPELSKVDEIDNPSGWGGGVFVDIDPDLSLITISPDDARDFETATVTITASGITGLFTVQDDLWENRDDPSVGPMPPVTTQVTDSGVVIAWDRGEEGSLLMKEDGAAIFRYFTGTMNVSPVEVAAGSPVTISGDGCATGAVEVVVGERAGVPLTPAPDGTWSTEVDTSDLSGTVVVSATCVFGDTGFDYAPATLEVTTDQETTTTIAPAGPTTTVPATPATPGAAPASPVRAAPSYTG